MTAAGGAGRITGESFGNGATTTRSYEEPKQRLQSILTTAGGSTVQDLGYAYDDRLNLIQRSDLQQGKTEDFSHDRLDRLWCIQINLDPNLPQCFTHYSYAPNGNVLFKPGVGAYGYDPDQPHAATSAGGSTYTYDEVGNQRTRPGATITYTAFDLPKTFTLDQGGTITLDYDGGQRRIRKTTPEQETVYVGDLYERETDLITGAVEHRYYVHGAERAVAMVRPQAASPARMLYMHVDHLGSVEALTDEAGAVVERRSYDAFGARRNPAWGSPPPASYPPTSSLGFTGHEDDAELPTCLDDCKQFYGWAPWCGDATDALYGCSIEQPATSYECSEGSNPELKDEFCTTENDALFGCFFEGPAGGVPDMTADCKAYCDATAGLPCAQANCLQDCLGSVEDAKPCNGAYAMAFHCLARLPASSYQCSAGDKPEVTGEQCLTQGFLLLACTQEQEMP